MRSRMFSQLSFADSVAPHLAISRGGRIMPLEQLCHNIDNCESLARAKILSVECYRERSIMGILHRTLLFELCRPDRRNIWLRIDRRMDKMTSLSTFVLRGGKTRANDEVCSFCKAHVDPLIEFQSSGSALG